MESILVIEKAGRRIHCKGSPGAAHHAPFDHDRKRREHRIAFTLAKQGIISKVRQVLGHVEILQERLRRLGPGIVISHPLPHIMPYRFGNQTGQIIHVGRLRLRNIERCRQGHIIYRAELLLIVIILGCRIEFNVIVLNPKHIRTVATGTIYANQIPPDIDPIVRRRTATQLNRIVRSRCTKPALHHPRYSDGQALFLSDTNGIFRFGTLFATSGHQQSRKSQKVYFFHVLHHFELQIKYTIKNGSGISPNPYLITKAKIRYFP